VCARLSEAGDGVEGALLPVRAFALQIGDVQLAAQPAHDLLGEQVVHQGRLHATVLIAQLQNEFLHALIIISRK
jgi:hypothetical protein